MTKRLDKFGREKQRVDIATRKRRDRLWNRFKRKRLSDITKAGYQILLICQECSQEFSDCECSQTELQKLASTWLDTVVRSHNAKSS